VYIISIIIVFFFFSSRRRHTRFSRDWSSDVCSSDLKPGPWAPSGDAHRGRHGPAAQYETPPDGAQGPGFSAAYPRDEVERADDRRRHDAHGDREKGRAPARIAPGGAPGGDGAPAKHGHDRRQPVPRYALQLLQPELRMAQGDRLLPEEGRRHLLGRHREQALRGDVVDRLRAGAD